MDILIFAWIGLYIWKPPLRRSLPFVLSGVVILLLPLGGLL